MMKHHHIRFVYLFSALVLMTACSANFLNPHFSDFSDSTLLLGKNIEYVLERSMEEELNLRMAESLQKNEISPTDFQPKVLTTRHLEIRKELINYLTGYSQLLTSLINNGQDTEFNQQAARVYANIRFINLNHGGFLRGEEQGMIATCAAAISEAMTSVKRRRITIKIMEENQPRLEKIVTTLKEEIHGLQIMLNNFYNRQFRLKVSGKWGENAEPREKLAYIAKDIIYRRDKINVIFTDLATALSYIPRTHRKLKEALQKNGSPSRVAADLLDFTYRIQSNFQEFSQ